MAPQCRKVNMSLVPKSRILPGEKVSWGKDTVRLFNFGPKTYSDAGSPGSFDGSGFQLTESESHSRSRDGKYREGGPFYTYRETVSGAPQFTSGVSKNIYNFGPGQEYPESKWDGPILFPVSAVNAFGAMDLKPRSKDTSDLEPLGTTAISRCAPANPASELGTGVSELYREGLPSLPGVASWRKRTQLAKAAGSEYLNTVFGWVPLVGEVNAFSGVASRVPNILNQYKRNAGGVVQRQYQFSTGGSGESSIEYESAGYASVAGFQSGSDFVDAGPGKITITRRSETKRWFVGAFTYDVPSQSDSWQKALGYGSRADILYGASLNPSLLWNLAPWSWAVDWFSNTGDVINNISNYVRAGQIMRYGYMMEESISSLTLSMSSSGWKNLPAPRPFKREIVSKVRVAANPYGFGISIGDLSTQQVLIAAALGITLL
jgi:hypothetical protein